MIGKTPNVIRMETRKVSISHLKKLVGELAMTKVLKVGKIG